MINKTEPTEQEKQTRLLEKIEASTRMTFYLIAIGMIYYFIWS